MDGERTGNLVGCPEMCEGLALAVHTSWPCPILSAAYNLRGRWMNDTGQWRTDLRILPLVSFTSPRVQEGGQGRTSTMWTAEKLVARNWGVDIV